MPDPLNGFQVYRRLLHYVRRYWFIFLLGVIGAMIESGMTASFTWLIKPLLDKGFIARDKTFIRWLPLGIIVAFLLRGGGAFLSNYCMNWVGRSVIMRFRQDIFAHLLRLPARFYDHCTSGHLLSTIIYNVEQVAQASTNAIITLVQESCFIIGLVVVMVINSWQLSLLFFITTPLIAAIARYSSKRMRRLSNNVQDSMGEITHVAEEAISGYKVIRTFGGESYEVEKFQRITEKNRLRELKIVATNSLSSAGVQQIAGILIALTIYLATLNTSDVTAGGFTSMIAAMLALLKPMRNLTSISNTIQKGIAAAASIFKLLDEAPEQDQGTRYLTRAKGAIEYKNVSFSYQTDKPILQHINFKVAAGQTVAVVGRSGSGKSTLVSLLPRFYYNFSGNIVIDGIDTQEIHLKDLRDQFALVSQQVILFNDTIARNIAYGRSAHASETEIFAAAKAAHALEFIDTFPDGLHTLIGENGVLLSGGQRQRIAIARALLKNAPILILDEATSALDTESERHIQEALEELMHNRTTLVIAHRLSTIEKADNILVLDAGRLAEAGTHEQLLAQNGYYAKLYKMQFKDFPQ